jgi:peptidoglycan/LPS O-acetylase OafA/YrhL
MNETAFRVSSPRLLALLAATSVLGSTLSVLNMSESYNALYAFAPISLALLLHGIPKDRYGFSGSSGLRWIGRNSLVFYVVHFPVQTVFFNSVSNVLSGNVLLLYLLVFLAGILVPAALVLIRKHSLAVSALFDLRVFFRNKARTATD